ncbi:hypothetical protein ACO1O0_002207 [Amphichorda felina]
MPSTDNVSAQTPAWKRLGLKLKQPGAAAGAVPASQPANGSSAVGHPGGSTGHKRKVEAPPSTDGSPVKRTRREEQPVTQNGSPSSSKPKKSVKFGDTPSKNEGRSPPPPARNKPKPTKEAQQAKKSKGAADKQTPPVADIKPALEYLRQWKTSRESWKFNKNNQSALIRHIFEPNTIPASDVDTFCEYIRDLKGFVRQRLRETAMEIKMQDVADGAAGFPDGTMDLDDKQEKYDSILADILRRKRQQTGQKRKFFSEMQYVSESQDGDVIIHRVIKRMRTELVLEELSESGEETEDTTTSTTSSQTITASDNNATTKTNGNRPQPKLNDGPGRRRRKLRVNMDDTSSSESESESDSDDTSSSGSDEDSDSEGEADERPTNGYETSSSSSSSSSGGDSDSEEESDED